MQHKRTITTYQESKIIKKAGIFDIEPILVSPLGVNSSEYDTPEDLKKL